MLLYVIGPSGVGVTTLITEARKKRSSIIHISVNDYVKAKDPYLHGTANRRWGEFWALSLKCFRTNEALYNDSTDLCLIDVDSGCLETEEALAYFKSKDNVLLIEDKPESIFKRNPHWADKSPLRFERFRKIEYSKLRKKIYKSCDYSLRVAGLDLDEAVDSFIDICDQATSS